MKHKTIETRPLIINGVDFSETMTSGEIARLFRVDGKTVARWAKSGKISHFRTLGGHRRFSRAEIEALIEGCTR